MRQITVILLMTASLLLSACGAQDAVLRDALSFRETLLEEETCSFRSQITAEVEERRYVFSLNALCSGSEAALTVVMPESIAGIEAVITGMDARLSFGGAALDFGLMDRVMTSPLYLPYLLDRCWREAWIECAGEDGELYRATYLWGSGEETLTVETWFLELTPVYAEVYRQDRLLLSAQIEAFTFGA